MTPSPVLTQLKGNEKSLTADFHSSALTMLELHIFGISDKWTETTKSYLKYNDELRWLCNTVFLLLSCVSL